MEYIIKISVCIVVVGCVSGCRDVSEADIEGVWVGNTAVTDFEMAKATEGLTDEEKRIVEGLKKMMEMSEPLKPRLRLEQDHTFRLMNVLEGTWEFTDMQVVLTPAASDQPNGESDGTDGGFERPIALTVSRDGKTLTSVDTDDNPVRKLVFTKEE